MKKTLCVFLAMLLAACTFVPAFAAGGTYNVSFVGPSAALDADAFSYYKTVNGEFAEFEEDPDGPYGHYSVDNCYYYIADLTSSSRKVFDNAPEGSEEAKRFSPKQCENGPVAAGTTVAFIVVTNEKYDRSSVRVLCNGVPVDPNTNGEFAVTADQDLVFRVVETDENNMPVLLRNHYVISLTSGDGYAAKPLKDSNNKVVYYGDSYEFRVKITKGFNGDNMKVKVIRGTSFLSEFIGEDADLLTSVMGDAETLASTGVDIDGYRTYRIDNITTDCKVLISGVNNESSSGVMAMFKRILRLLLGLLGINLDNILGEDNNPLAAYTITLNTNINAIGVTYKTTPEFKYNSETGHYEAEVLSGECVTIVVTKPTEATNVVVDWTGRDPASYSPDKINWQAYYDVATQKTTWSAVWYVDSITSNIDISITA